MANAWWVEPILFLKMLNFWRYKSLLFNSSRWSYCSIPLYEWQKCVNLNQYSISFPWIALNSYDFYDCLHFDYSTSQDPYFLPLSFASDSGKCRLSSPILSLFSQNMGYYIIGKKFEPSSWSPLDVQCPIWVGEKSIVGTKVKEIVSEFQIKENIINDRFRNCFAPKSITFSVLFIIFDSSIKEVNRRLARHSPRVKASNAIACNTVREVELDTIR